MKRKRLMKEAVFYGALENITCTVNETPFAYKIDVWDITTIVTTRSIPKNTNDAKQQALKIAKEWAQKVERINV